MFLTPCPPGHAWPQETGQSPEFRWHLFSWPAFPCFEFPSPHLSLIYPGNSFLEKVVFGGLLRHKHSHICYFHILLITLVHMSGSLGRDRGPGGLSIAGGAPWACGGQTGRLLGLEDRSSRPVLAVDLFLHSLSFPQSLKGAVEGGDLEGLPHGLCSQTS